MKNRSLVQTMILSIISKLNECTLEFYKNKKKIEYHQYFIVFCVHLTMQSACNFIYFSLAKEESKYYLFASTTCSIKDSIAFIFLFFFFFCSNLLFVTFKCFHPTLNVMDPKMCINSWQNEICVFFFFFIITFVVVVEHTSDFTFSIINVYFPQ